MHSQSSLKQIGVAGRRLYNHAAPAGAWKLQRSGKVIEHGERDRICAWFPSALLFRRASARARTEADEITLLRKVLCKTTISFHDLSRCRSPAAAKRL